MRFYFSGISSPEERQLLEAAGITRALVDQFDASWMPGWQGDLILDSGAYHLFKERRSVSVLEYVQRIDYLNRMGLHFKWITSADVIGNPLQSLKNFRELRESYHLEVVPVWAYGSDFKYLEYYLNTSLIVGLGGLVPLIRNKTKKDFTEELTEQGVEVTESSLKDCKEEWDSQRETVLQQLEILCKQYPGRFHFFGLCWLKAMERLSPYLVSADASIWHEPARKGMMIFEHTKTHKLTRAPIAALPQYKGMARNELKTTCARNINSYINMR